jgi:hypothetical protein
MDAAKYEAEILRSNHSSSAGELAQDGGYARDTG